MFCIFSNVRYSNPKLMHIGHQYMEQTFDPKQLMGLLELQTFHISPDKGLGIFTFDNQQNMTKYLPNLKDFNKDYEDRFSCKITVDTGILNPELSYKA